MRNEAIPSVFRQQVRRLASVATSTAKSPTVGDHMDNVKAQDKTPMQEYDDRVHTHRLRDDPHQRGMEID